MSRVEFAVEKVKRLDETQAEALLEWLELRENREALRQRLDKEIEIGLDQLKRGRRVLACRCMPKSRNAADTADPAKMADYFTRERRGSTCWRFGNISRRQPGRSRPPRTEVQQAVSMLARNPDLGHLRRDLTSKPVRFWAVHSYLIIYDPAARPLEVVRILSGYRDIASLLK
jgi:plasmid stabilization system protein ParE